MKLAILSEKDKRPTDLALLREGRDHFDKVLLVPFSNLSISLDPKIMVRYRNKDLMKYDAILISFSKQNYNTAYVILKNYPGYSPTKMQSFQLTLDRFAMFDHLSRNSIPVPRTCILNSSKPMLNILSDFRFPISIKVKSKERGIMFADNMNEAKTMIDTLTSLNELIYAEEHYTSDLIEAYIIGSEVMASVKRKPKTKEDVLYGKGKMEKIKLSKELEDLAISAADSVKTEFARVDLIEDPQRVIGIDVTPQLLDVSKETGKNVARELISYVRQSAELKEKGSLSWFSKFIEFAKGRLME